MKVAGIVAEYNPFHNGHKLHIEKAKEATGADKVIAVMSGNFVQRGEPAIFDKWLRTKAALENGCDAVIELPLYFSTASAEFFALGAVDILNKTNCTDFICFGAENDNTDEIIKAASALSNESDDFKRELKFALEKGLSYPKARGIALNKTCGIDESVLSTPNNILAVEYVKALIFLKSHIKPIAVKRMYTEYNSTETNGVFASATAIRDMLKKGNNISPFVPFDYKASPVFPESISTMLSYKLRILGKDGLSEILDISEGLENRILEGTESCSDYCSLVKFLKTKRYTHTRIQRSLIHAFLDITKEDFSNVLNSGLNPYIRILGFRKDSQELVSKIAKLSSVPVVTTVKSRDCLDDLSKKMLSKESTATDLYYLLKNEPKLNKDLTTSIVII